ncbi:DegT/DnrJ/EryC1/StrS family aminotransferase [Candidatus Microgenomates bacterium]|nr:MAG: DegT/DnrJ/EryC1/StrS family aminotransferase [Candidatus Microgenomates bacterium]
MKKPAVEGGAPVRKDFLIFGKPTVSKAEINEVVDTLRSGWLGTGPKTKKFETDFQKYIGAKYAIAVNSCTAGLHLALDVIGIRAGDEVITTPLTFASTANVIEHHDAKPVFVDVEKDTGNIDPQKIAQKITKKTKAIIPVDLHGRPCRIDEIMMLARKHKLFAIEDAAHAVETVHQGKKIGNIAHLTAFSFYVTKNVMTGEGGMLTTNDKKWEYEARTRSLHGISRDAWKRYSADGFQPYETLYPGYKYNMMDLVASLGIHQLADVENNWKKRAKYWQMYNQAFATIPEISIPASIESGDRHAYHVYALNLGLEKLKINRNQFIDALKHEGIGSGIHFTPLHLHAYYKKKYHYKRGDFPNSEHIGERTISLPLSPYLTTTDVQDVIDAVVKLVTYYKK